MPLIPFLAQARLLPGKPLPLASHPQPCDAARRAETLPARNAPDLLPGRMFTSFLLQRSSLNNYQFQQLLHHLSSG